MDALINILNTVDSIVYNFVHAAYLQLSPTTDYLLRLMLILFLTIYGYRVAISGNFEARHLFMQTFKMVMIVVLATTWDDFTIAVYDLATKFPRELGAEILLPNNKNTETLSAEIFAFMDNVTDIISDIVLKGSFYNPSPYIYAVLIYLITIAFVGYVMFLIILSKFALAIMLAVAPIFIVLLVFSQTTELFMGWLRTLLNYALIPLFVYALLALLSTIIDNSTTDLALAAESGKGILQASIPYLITIAICFLLALQIMNIVAGISGGYSLSTMGGMSYAYAKARWATPRVGKGSWWATKGVAKGGWAVAKGTAVGGVQGASAVQRALMKNRGIKP